MKIEQLYTGCLAEAAYYIESDGEAAIIDPLRETKPYIERATKDNAKIKYILETHFHADFVSGHLDLSHKTGATIVFGPTASPYYPAYIASDNELLKLGAVSIKVLHTPGHTMESTSYLLIDEHGKEKALFTGDTLFIGDVGRPDLVQKLKADITPQYLAKKLFHSLRDKILPLPDDVIVYPGHGAGSACGKNMAKETTDTLGHQKMYNYALRANMTEDEFVKEVTEGLVEPPQYFPSNVLMNLKGGVESIDAIIKRGTQPLSPHNFKMSWEALEALVIDTRKKEAFAKAHIPGSVFIGLDDQFAPWAGALITDMDQPILLITEEGREEEAVIRLSRVGYDNTLGYLKGGMDAWTENKQEVDSLHECSALEFAKEFQNFPSSIILLDVRRKSEFDTMHLVGAENFPLDNLNKNMAQLDTSRTYYIHCAGGFRSVIAASILKSRGFHNLVNIKGGFTALAETSLQKTSFQKQHTTL